MLDSNYPLMPIPAARKSPRPVRSIHKRFFTWDEPHTESPLRFRGGPLWRLIALCCYAVTAVGITFWMAKGPHVLQWQWVLRTGQLPVNQLYSGFILSVMLLPAAVLIRSLCDDFGLLHPFAIASREPVSLVDLDHMLDLGPRSLVSIRRYSNWKAVLQLLLMIAGALLVPVGTLAVTTGIYAPPTAFTTVAGMPVLESTKIGPNHLSLSSAMGYTGHGPFISKYDSSDFFLKIASDAWRGDLLSSKSWAANDPGVIGPMATRDFKFETGARYDGLVTFAWNSTCFPAFDDVTFWFDGQGNNTVAHFRFPDGSVSSAAYPMSASIMWSNATTHTASGIPLGGWGYTVMATLPDSIKNGSYADAITLDTPPTSASSSNSSPQPRAVFLTKCSSHFNWALSACTYTGTRWEDCRASPNSNTTALDTVALDALEGYMSAVPWSLVLQNDYVLKLGIYSINSIPSLREMTGVSGTVANTLIALATGGAFGYADVRGVGGAEVSVYIARVPVVLAVVGALLLVTLALVADVGYNVRKRLPFQKMTFLAIASAVSGPSLEHDYYCNCLVPASLTATGGARKGPAKKKVMFGLLSDSSGHVGLGKPVEEFDDV